MVATQLIIVTQSASSEKNMALLPFVADDVWSILVIIICIFLGVALVGLTYCLNYWCVTKKKKNEASAISKVEKMEDHANGIEIIHKEKLPKVKEVTYDEKKDGYMDPNCLKEFNTWLNPKR